MLLVHFIRGVSEDEILSAACCAGLEYVEPGREVAAAAQHAGLGQSSCRLLLLRRAS